MGRRPSGDYKVRKTLNIGVNLCKWVDRHGFEYSQLLEAKIFELIDKDEQRKAEEAAAEFTKDDQGPHTADETKSYLEWCDAHPEAKTEPYVEKFKLWRETLKSSASTAATPA